MNDTCDSYQFQDVRLMELLHKLKTLERSTITQRPYLSDTPGEVPKVLSDVIEQAYKILFSEEDKQELNKSAVTFLEKEGFKVSTLTYDGLGVSVLIQTAKGKIQL